MFLPADRYKYSVALPSKEWKDRDVSTPLEAIRVVYEVDLSYGALPAEAMSIFADIFRKMPEIYSVILQCKETMPEGVKATSGKREPLR